MLNLPHPARPLAHEARFKSPPADLLSIEGVVATPPQVFMRVLDLVLVHGGTPVVIQLQLRPASARFALQVDGLVGDGARLVSRLHAVIGVRAIRARGKGFGRMAA